MAKFTWGDEVRVGSQALPDGYSGAPFAAICGVRHVRTPAEETEFGVPSGSAIYLVELGSGVSFEVAEEWLSLDEATGDTGQHCGLPKDVDSSLFKDHRLVRICIASRSLTLRFHPEVKLTITSSIGCKNPSAALRRYQDYAVAAPLLMEYLDKRVTEIEGTNDKLRLLFEGNRVLEIYADSRAFESFSIESAESDILVV